MGLKKYRSRRNFDITPEPEPGPGSTSSPVKESADSSPALLVRGEEKTEPDRENQLIFVIQKHAARALHYDLRLELEGALKSWAVPKGPTLDPSLKRLAVMVEDHPLEYKDFEGIIPKGNYGAGNVIIWDRGFYHHPSDANGTKSTRLLLEGLRKGHIKFILDGQKLQGEFSLIKTGKDGKSWLLMKKKDRFASVEDVLARNRSIVSDETIEDIAKASPGQSPRREAMENKAFLDAPLKPMPHNIKPMLATLIKAPFDHEDWIFEMKWDGYRALAEIRDGAVALYSRNLIPLDRRFSPVTESLRKIPFEAALDGEIVVVDERGYPDFQMLQDYNKSRRGELLYYVFDLLHLKGHDLTDLPLIKRKELLKTALPSIANVKVSDHIAKDGILFFQIVKEKGLEGIIAKHSQSPYRMNTRSRQWLKIKTHITQEAVIAGFTEPRGRRKDFGALVLGLFEGNEFVFIGHTGGGFSAKKLKEVRSKLNPLIRKKSPFRIDPQTNTPVTWVKPEMVCEVLFQGWTAEGLMRQPVFSRLREDKTAREVVRERPVDKK